MKNYNVICWTENIYFNYIISLVFLKIQVQLPYNHGYRGMIWLMENYYLVDLKELQCYLNFQVKKFDEEKIKVHFEN